MTPYEVVLDVFGGIRSVGRVLDIEGSTVLRWGKTGRVPLDYFQLLLEAAQARGKRLGVEELCFGRPAIARRIHWMDRPSETLGALGRMAVDLTRRQR